MDEDRKELQALIQNLEGYLAVNPSWRNEAWGVRAEAYRRAGDEGPWAALMLYVRGLEAIAAADYVEAIQLYEKAAHLDPGYPWSANNLAWVLSTCPDERLRDGKTAILYSRWSFKVPKVEVAAFFSTLAAAHAADGDFEAAERLCEKSIEIWPDEESERMRHAFRQGCVHIDRGPPPEQEDFISREGCGRAKWGMSKMDVKAVHPKMVIEDNDTTTVRGLRVLGHRADAVFYFHSDMLFRAVVRIAGVSPAVAEGLSFRKMEIEEGGAKNGNRTEKCWGSEETRARVQYDPRLRSAVIEFEGRKISALRKMTRAGRTNTVQ